MALNGKIIQRVTGVKSSDVMHSSGYANTQNAGNFGAASTESFSERLEIEKNREIVQSYNRAKVAQRANMMPKARTYQQELEEKRKRAMERSGGTAQDDAQELQKFNSRLERGGLDMERVGSGGAMSFSERQAYAAAQKEARTAIGSARSAEARQAMAQRFSGTRGGISGPARAGSAGRFGAGMGAPSTRVSGGSRVPSGASRPTPRTGGFGPSFGPNFGRH